MGERGDRTAELARLPVAQIAARALHARPRLVAAQPYATSLAASFSGSTAYLAEAGIAGGHLDGGFGLVAASPAGRAEPYARAAAWRLRERIAGRPGLGYKFAPGYRASFWRRALPRLRGCDIVNNFQLFGRDFHTRRRDHGVGAIFYIDGTLTDYFDTYGAFETDYIRDDLRRAAIAEETAGYRDADAVIAMSESAAATLRRVYGIDPARVHVVVPGANLPDDGFVVRPVANGGPFTLGFVGVFPMRKGLDRLATATTMLRARGIDVRLRVIGRCPDEIAALDGVDYRGFIDKKRDPQAFADALSGVDLGCLLSHAELAGIALVEFLRFGIPVMGSGAGGMIDILDGGGSVLAPVALSDEELAGRIAALATDPAAHARLRAEAEARRDWASWRRAAGEIAAVIEQFTPRGAAR